MFHDGRIETGPDGLRTPMEDEMLAGFTSLLSAQTMFPVLSPDEMAGQYGENDVSKAVRSGRITGENGAWDILAKRVAGIPAYAEGFAQIGIDQIAFTDISNVIASFIALEWRADDSPFDAYLRGDGTLGPDATKGMDMFYGAAQCATCHSGPFQTDHGFHATGQPQFGPGKAAAFETHARDTGRMRVTGDMDDAYRFRTPSLRNVSRTAPYGHSGAYPTLKSFLTAHASPVTAITTFDPNKVLLPDLEVDDRWVMDRPEEVSAIATSVGMTPVDLTAQDIAALIAFLHSLDDETALTGRLGIPDRRTKWARSAPLTGDPLIGIDLQRLPVRHRTIRPDHAKLRALHCTETKMQRADLTADMAPTERDFLLLDAIPCPHLHLCADGIAIGPFLRQVHPNPMPRRRGHVLVQFQRRASVDDHQIEQPVTVEIGQLRTAGSRGGGCPGLHAALDEPAITRAHQQIVRIAHGHSRHLVDIALGDEQIAQTIVIRVAELRMPARRWSAIVADMRPLRRGADLEPRVFVPVRHCELKQLIAHRGQHDFRTPRHRSDRARRCPFPRCSPAPNRRRRAG